MSFTMPTSKNIFTLYITATLLSVFLLKFSFSVHMFHNAAKIGYVIPCDPCDNQGDDNNADQPNDNDESLLKITDDFDRVSAGFLVQPATMAADHLRPGYLQDFIPAYYPSIITPPPNC